METRIRINGTPHKKDAFIAAYQRMYGASFTEAKMAWVKINLRTSGCGCSFIDDIVDQNDEWRRHAAC